MDQVRFVERHPAVSEECTLLVPLFLSSALAASLTTSLSSLPSPLPPRYPSFPLPSEVTERHRTPSIPSRLFTGMVEITQLINHYGHRGNRGEMGEVRKWIEERGVGAEVLGRVLNLGPSA